jgi:hypothetical protein
MNQEKINEIEEWLIEELFPINFDNAGETAFKMGVLTTYVKMLLREIKESKSESETQ